MAETKYEPNAKFLNMIATEDKNTCWLAIDHRERSVLEHHDNFDHIPFRPLQMTVGDYAVCRGNKILAIIERKSLEDYAASLKDGRHANKNKMTKLRDDIGCRVIYIVEGPLDPSPDKMFGRTPYKYIENSIYHIMIRDHILVLRTRDPVDTSKKLARFVESMSTLEWEPAEILDLTTGVEVVGGLDENASVDNILRADRSKTDSDVLRELWACFKGITIESAEHYIRRWSLSDVILKRIPRTGPGSPSEIKINNRHIAKHVQAQLLNPQQDLKLRLLSIVPGISNKSAEEILDQISLDVMLEIGVEEVKQVQIGKKQKSLGENKAKHIIKLFNDSEKLIG
jgi:ERCC4-type nuclease